MAVDRYTKLVLTVIAVCLVCLVWLSAGGPSPITPVSAQQGVEGNRVILAGWVDARGVVVPLPAVPTSVYRNQFGTETGRDTPTNWPLPMTDTLK